MNMARCLIFEKKLPKTFWVEAVNTSVYLLNRLPTKGLSSRQVDPKEIGAVERSGSCRQVYPKGKEAVDGTGSSRQGDNCTGKAVDRFAPKSGSNRHDNLCVAEAFDRLRMSSRRAGTNRQVEIGTGKDVDRFAPESSESSSSRKDQSGQKNQSIGS